jgi:DNA-directed RNA polymerase subunit N
MIIPIRCFTCGKIMADKIDFYNEEVAKLKKVDDKDNKFKNFDSVHTKDILDKLGLSRYCCRRNLISNVDIMDVV